jgi:hypothetical protein
MNDNAFDQDTTRRQLRRAAWAAIAEGVGPAEVVALVLTEARLHVRQARDRAALVRLHDRVAEDVAAARRIDLGDEAGQ